MKKTIISIVTIFSAFSLVATPAFAAVPASIRPMPTATAIPLPKCGNKTAQSPVTLSGRGVVCARGYGQFGYKVKRGRVTVRGHGVVAVKGTDLVNVNGFGGKFELHGWVFYWGRGTLSAKGKGYKVRGWMNRAHTRGVGVGKVTFRGDNWKVRYGRLRVQPVEALDAVEIPTEVLKSIEINVSE